jgi:hypothetical protein
MPVGAAPCTQLRDLRGTKTAFEPKLKRAKCSSSENATSSTASQGIPRSVWHGIVHYRVHNSPPHVAVLGKTKPVHVLPSYFLEIHFNIILHICLEWAAIAQ